MDFWTAIVIIVAIGTFSEMVQARMKKGNKELEKDMSRIGERLTGVEDRMANLETIVLERERHRAFSKLED